MLEEREDRVERRTEVDDVLASYGSRTIGQPDRETWGKLPHQQRAMKAATEAGGNVGRG